MASNTAQTESVQVTRHRDVLTIVLDALEQEGGLRLPLEIVIEIRRYYLSSILPWWPNYYHLGTVKDGHCWNEPRQRSGSTNQEFLRVMMATNWSYIPLLHFKRKDYDTAASLDHFEIVKFLNTKEFYDDEPYHSIIDEVASSGYLKMAEWLYINRNERCTFDAMEFAARDGNLDAMQWLYDHGIARGEFAPDCFGHICSDQEHNKPHRFETVQFFIDKNLVSNDDIGQAISQLQFHWLELEDIREENEEIRRFPIFEDPNLKKRVNHPDHEDDRRMRRHLKRIYRQLTGRCFVENEEVATD